MLQAVRDTGGFWGLQMPVDFVRGSRNAKIMKHFGSRLARLPSYGEGAAKPAEWWKAVAHMLLDQYAGVVGQSKAFDQKLKLLKERTCVELRNQRQLMALQGMTESILLGGQAMGE